MKRREFVALLGGAAVAWPLAARAQQTPPMRRIGVLMNFGEDDNEGQRRVTLFKQILQQAGWSEGRNVQFEMRWAAGRYENYRRFATELVALRPDVILAVTTTAVKLLQEASRMVPIVFTGVIDPVGSGLITGFSHPGGNATGFVTFEYALAAKWLELLKEIAPQVTRAAVLRNPTIAAGIGQFAAIQTVGAVGIELAALDFSDIERTVAEFARSPNGGLIATASSFAANHPVAIATLALQYKLPSVYPFRYFVSAGGLMSYGPDQSDEYRRAATYVDRILKGEKPADLPVQAPTRYDLTINLKTAKALGLTIPPTLLARADEVIE
jgi:putative ABC transport system substrate-binding protein